MKYYNKVDGRWNEVTYEFFDNYGDTGMVLYASLIYPLEELLKTLVPAINHLEFDFEDKTCMIALDSWHVND